MDSVIYAFTWSPDPKVFYGYNKPIQQHTECMTYLRKLHACVDTVEIYPELNLNGNIHYHGIIQITDSIKWFKSVLPTLKRNGFVCIKRIGNKTGWNEYITKETKYMVEILDIELPILKTHLKPSKKTPENTDKTIYDYYKTEG